MNKCECGKCELSVKEHRRFIHGHNSKNLDNHSWNRGLTKETDERIANAALKTNHLLKGRKGRKISDETKEKIRQTLLGHEISENTRAKISKTLKKRIETLNRINQLWIGTLNIQYVAGFLGRKHTDSTKKKISTSRSGIYHTEKTKTRISETSKERWADSEYKQRTLSNMLRSTSGSKPNRLEKAFQELLQKNFSENWTYVGDGKLIIDGKCPDFWDGKNKFIELYGDYWHKGQDPQERINFFKQYGYDCLVIWEREMKNPNDILERIKNF